MPQIEWNRDNPNLNAGAVYKNMAELQNARTMYCIQSNNVYGSEKYEKQKLTVHCPYPRCSWKLHATGMRGKKTIQIREPFQPREHDFVASASRSNQGATPTPDTSVPEITRVPAKNPARKEQAKKVVQPMSVPAKNTRSKVVAPSSNTRSKRRV
ncbi:hypothetical protein D1007_34023 [Hordeum vulgare]|nr:hypothetical protein D1007_34023 [Hordeum vulgare]